MATLAPHDEIPTCCNQHDLAVKLYVVSTTHKGGIVHETWSDRNPNSEANWLSPSSSVTERHFVRERPVRYQRR